MCPGLFRNSHSIQSVAFVTIKQLVVCNDEFAVYCENRTKQTHCTQNVGFLYASAKLRKATISFVMFVCPSVRMEQLGLHWKDFH